MQILPIDIDEKEEIVSIVDDTLSLYEKQQDYRVSNRDSPENASWYELCGYCLPTPEQLHPLLFASKSHSTILPVLKAFNGKMFFPLNIEGDSDPIGEVIGETNIEWKINHRRQKYLSITPMESWEYKRLKTSMDYYDETGRYPRIEQFEKINSYSYADFLKDVLECCQNNRDYKTSVKGVSLMLQAINHSPTKTAKRAFVKLPEPETENNYTGIYAGIGFWRRTGRIALGTGRIMLGIVMTIDEVQQERKKAKQERKKARKQGRKRSTGYRARKKASGHRGGGYVSVPRYTDRGGGFGIEVEYGGYEEDYY